MVDNFFRSQAWGHHFGIHDHHLLALAAAERQLLESEYDDYAVANDGNVTYLRSIAVVVCPDKYSYLNLTECPRYLSLIRS